MKYNVTIEVYINHIRIFILAITDEEVTVLVLAELIRTHFTLR